MNSGHLNEHDTHQGAQSSGEFLGMTGNSGWFLLGSAGATILMVILLWGVLGVSLLLCLLVGLLLCGLSLAYVFALKNNRPAHYDTDFFEAVLVEAGVMRFSFGGRARPSGNPFHKADRSAGATEHPAAGVVWRRTADHPASHAPGPEPEAKDESAPAMSSPKAASRGGREPEPTVPQRDYERLREQLTTTEEMLEDALSERGED